MSAPRPLDLRGRFDEPPLPAVELRLLLQSEHRRDADRYLSAAQASLRIWAEWLGPLPRTTLTLTDPPWGTGTPPSAGDGAVALERVAWWSRPTSMAPELATARAMSRRFWRELVDTRDLPAWFVDGLAEYVARRIVTPIFQSENLEPGYAFLELRYFDGFVPRFVRLRLLPETDGDPMPAYRAHPDAGIAAVPETVAQARSLEAKTILILGTLERWVGRPVFDQVLAQFVRGSRGHPPTIAEFTRIASNVSGQDLQWFFDEAFGSSRIFDYGVEGLTSERGPDGLFVTTVTARRYGDALFTGTSADPVDGFESGRGVTLLVTFADAQRRIDYWDGRDRQKRFRYRSPAPAVSASIDPDRTLLLDLNRTNDSRTLAPRAATAAWRWAGRWMAWLENALLNYAAFV